MGKGSSASACTEILACHGKGRNRFLAPATLGSRRLNGGGMRISGRGLVLWAVALGSVAAVLYLTGQSSDSSKVAVAVSSTTSTMDPVRTTAAPSSSTPATSIESTSSMQTSAPTTTANTIVVETLPPQASSSPPPAPTPPPPPTQPAPTQPTTTAAPVRTIKVKYVIPFLSHTRDSHCNREKYWSTPTVQLRDHNYVLIDTRTVPNYGTFVLQESDGSGYCEFPVTHRSPDRPSWEFVYEASSTRADNAELRSNNWEISIIVF